MTSTLVFARDPALLEEILRLTAAAGVTPSVAADGGAALRAWSGASLVLVGADAAEELARLRPPRRSRVHVLSWGPPPDPVYRVALTLGAEDVSELPRASSWLTDSLSDAGESRVRSARTLGVVGGSGGAGATTLACAVGQVASRTGPTLVLDADPLGPGVDRLLGLDAAPGVRWDGLGRTAGRLGARALREAVPRRADLGVLTWHAGASTELDESVVRSVVSAAQRGHDTVVVDLPRSTDVVVTDLAARCDLVVVVVDASVAGLASAARLCARTDDQARLRLVVRGAGLDPEAVTRATGVPVLARLGDQRGLVESVDLGFGPVRTRRGPLARCAGELLSQLAARGAAA
ncbi:MAG: septum site determining protein [Actinobacteria bacterium]|uniref:Unannotated protein n=1 Tax=freshwater metagenome TaxID=449393 RepID=A0A6J6S7Y9_9ZZZZ|nr:septum site determining protein [Actinomycetota bacterium]